MLGVVGAGQAAGDGVAHVFGHAPQDQVRTVDIREGVAMEQAPAADQFQEPACVPRPR
ncbi:hypothetical protein D3C80_1173510 [compost metagenome]